ncbi:MAG: hypothetical protein Q8Q91_02930, partial [Candidatus Daviesbacteria bacterium]|nr:hypothetical protein [Candidatus Daviesbacteria bacterium]
MDKNYLIGLTQNLYRLTLLFPKKEPLRYKMRELANDILAKPNKECLEIILSYFEVAKSQNWVSPSDILNIQEEYSKLSGEFAIDLNQKSLNFGEAGRDEMGERQQKILAVLKDRGKAQA